MNLLTILNTVQQFFRFRSRDVSLRDRDRYVSMRERDCERDR